MRNGLKTKQMFIRRHINENYSSQSNDHGHEIVHRDFDITELRKAIKQMKNGKSPGLNNFYPEFLIHLDKNALLVLLKLFNYSWNCGVPAIWKKAIVVQIHKRNKTPDDLNNFQPISLTYVLSKVMERLIVCTII